MKNESRPLFVLNCWKITYYAIVTKIKGQKLTFILLIEVKMHKNILEVIKNIDKLPMWVYYDVTMS